MSLLMDALRKAEEAKKKAAQEGQSEQPIQAPVADEQELSAASEKVQDDSSVDSSTSEPGLRMADKEEMPPRAPVQNLKTDIEFEDEEDYVLPSSVGTPLEAETELIPEDSTDIAIEAEEGEPRVKAGNTEALEQDIEIEWAASPVVEEFESAEETVTASPEPLAFDSLEDQNQDNRSQASEGDAAFEASRKASSERESRPPARPLIVAKVDEKTKLIGAQRGQAQDNGKNEPERRTARNVFAAKQSRLSPQNLRVAAGGALVFAVFVFGTYFYTSFNQESTFNLPEGNYVASDFVDAGINSEIEGDLPANDLVTSTDGIENIATTENVQLPDSEETSALVRTAPPVSDDIEANLEELAVTAETAVVAIAPASPQIETITEPDSSVVNSQPQAIVSPGDPVAAAQSELPRQISEPAVVERQSTQEVVQTSAASSAQPEAAAQPTNLISFRKQASINEVDPNVSRAYTAYQQGSIDQAEALYRQTLAQDPLQRDALVGLATIATRNGNSAEALDLYSKLLARNPSDPIARAGLMELLPTGSPAQQEAEIRRLLNEHPNVATISYAYGNFLASDQRWSEAQQSYFKALQLAKADAVVEGLVNPDYAFNLAVSLEHLNQRESAENYYREALQFALNHPAGFDLAAVRSRLESMSRGGRDD